MVVNFCDLGIVIELCAYPSDNLISLSYSMPVFSANLFGLFLMVIGFVRAVQQRRFIFFTTTQSGMHCRTLKSPLEENFKTYIPTY